MTNYEKIKNMSVEEMAEWLEDTLSGNLCYLCAKKILINVVILRKIWKAE